MSDIPPPASPPEPGFPPCVEHGIWKPVPEAPPNKPAGLTLKLKDIDAKLVGRIKHKDVLTFHMVGCTGDYEDHDAQFGVAAAMAAQVKSAKAAGLKGSPADKASFFYHLGDVIYKPDQKKVTGRATGDGTGLEPAEEDFAAEPGRHPKALFNSQLYEAYAGYRGPIFAVAGNHDGKDNIDPAKSPIHHYLRNFCANTLEVSPDNRTDQRPAMIQPYIYWRLDTPLAIILGLYANVANGGILDNPHDPETRPQYDWLVSELKDIRKRGKEKGKRRAVLIAVHYPPYSGAANFERRGNPRLGPTNATNQEPLGAVLQRAFAESSQRPDAVFAAHAHLYQRLTYTYEDGAQIPYLIVGCGGHSIENIWTLCDGTSKAPAKAVPFEVKHAGSSAITPGASVKVVAYNDEEFGFLRVTVTPSELVGEYFVAYPGPLQLVDSFRVRLRA